MLKDVKSLIDYLCIGANRGSLESACRWYYNQLGTGDVYRADRGTLENIFFVKAAMEITPNGIYTISNPTTKVTHRYFSAAETVRYIMQKCKLSWGDWDGPRETKGNQLLTVTKVAHVEEA